MSDSTSALAPTCYGFKMMGSAIERLCFVNVWNRSHPAWHPTVSDGALLLFEQEIRGQSRAGKVSISAMLVAGRQLPFSFPRDSSGGDRHR